MSIYKIEQCRTLANAIKYYLMLIRELKEIRKLSENPYFSRVFFIQKSGAALKSCSGFAVTANAAAFFDSRSILFFIAVFP